MESIIIRKYTFTRGGDLKISSMQKEKFSTGLLSIKIRLLWSNSAQAVKVPAAKPENPSEIPETHMTEENNRFLQLVLDIHMYISV